MNREREQRLRHLDRFVALLGLLAFLMLVLRHGFPQLSVPRPLLLAWGVLLPIGFFLESLTRLLWVQNPWRYLRLHPLRYIILLMILLELSGAAAWSAAQTAPSGAGEILNRRSVSFTTGELYLAIVSLGFAGSWAQGVLTANRWLARCWRFRRSPLPRQSLPEPRCWRFPACTGSTFPCWITSLPLPQPSVLPASRFTISRLPSTPPARPCWRS